MHIKAQLVLVGIALLYSLNAYAGGIKRVATEDKVASLTFDDGPNPPYTKQLLNILEEKDVKATFFLIGKQVEEHPEIAGTILNAGHGIGGHSYDWEGLAFKRRKTVEGKLDQMDAAFVNAGITNVVLFRPPNGFLSPGQGKILEERGLVHISADVVVGDWKSISAETIRDRVLKKVRPGSIIVLHDGGGDRSATIKATEMIIDDLHSRGYTFQTVDRLIKHSQ